MSKLTDQPRTFLTKEKAISIAKTMSETDDWSYTPIHDPKGTGYSFIEIYDEEKEFVGYL